MSVMRYLSETILAASATVALLIMLSGTTIADVLDQKLTEVDKLRKGFDTDFDEVDRQRKAFLAEYTKPEEQARIYFQWVQVEGQSGLQHPDK